MTSDELILELLELERLTVDEKSGLVYASRSNFPQRPIGALTTKGYLRTSINYRGQLVCPMIHRIVWIAAHNIPAKGQVIDHKNRDKTDNRLCNLEAVTNAENIRRAKIAGAFVRCWRKPSAPRDSKGQYIRAGRLLDGREWNEMPEVQQC